MSEILNFLTEFEIWFYIILGLISIIFFARLFKAIGNWREAAFGLERDIAQRQFRSSLSILVLLLILFMGEFFFVTYSSSLLPDQKTLPTPTIDILASPSATSAAVAIETQEAGFSPTATAEQDGCVPGKIEWIYPVAGDEIEDVVQLLGTVDVENFGFFKYEYTEPGNPIWKTIAGGNQVVNQLPDHNENKIGLWNTSQLVPGDYLLRLVALDNANNEYPPCVIPVRVINP